MYHTEQVFASIQARKAPVITYKRRQNTYPCSNRPLTPTIISPKPTVLSAAPLQQQQTTTFKSTLLDESKGKNELQQPIGKVTYPPSTYTTTIKTTRLPTLDIFDFPDVDNNDTEVELRIASSLHNNGTKSNKNANKKSSLKAIKAPRNDASTNTNTKSVKVGSNFTSQGCPDLNKVNTTTIDRKNTDSPHIRLPANKSTIVSPSIWDISDTDTTSTRNIKPTCIKRPSSVHRTLSAPTLKAMPSYTQTMPLISPPHDVKKRKRNLVSQLKGANGERLDFCSQPSGSRFYNMSSDSDNDGDDINHNSITPHVTYLSEDNHSTTPSTLSHSSPDVQVVPMESSAGPDNYNERMEQELADLMRAEFGQLDEIDNLSSTSMLPSSSSSSSSSSSASSTNRPSYVPENSIRAPVTYKRFHNKSSLSTSSILSTNEMDLEMEQQIQSLLSNDL